MVEGLVPFGVFPRILSGVQSTEVVSQSYPTIILHFYNLPLLSRGHGKRLLAVQVIVPGGGCDGGSGCNGSGRSQIERRARVLSTGGCGGGSLHQSLVNHANSP